MGRERPYSVHCALDGFWVVDKDRDLIACEGFEAARLIAALMNGDLGAVANGTESDAADCVRMLADALEPLRRVGRPALASALPLL